MGWVYILHWCESDKESPKSADWTESSMKMRLQQVGDDTAGLVRERRRPPARTCQEMQAE
jgi:hypothetical protein